MKKHTSLRTMVLVASGTIALLGALALGLLVYLSDLFAHKADLLGSIASENTHETELIGLKRDLSLANDSQAKLDAAFVSDQGVPTFLESIEAVAAARNMKLTVDTLSVDDTAEGASSLRAQVAFSGSFADTQAFLAALENLPYTIDTSSFTLNVDTESADLWKGSVIFYLKSYDHS